jgi:hypothetical protein
MKQVTDTAKPAVKKNIDFFIIVKVVVKEWFTILRGKKSQLHREGLKFTADKIKRKYDTSK